jgi:hypothetical protein
MHSFEQFSSVKQDQKYNPRLYSDFSSDGAANDTRIDLNFAENRFGFL